jgi:hypothetical protein
MRILLCTGVFFLFFTGCQLPFQKEIDQTTQDIKDQSQVALEKGKETADRIRENALEIKTDIEGKIDDIDRAINEINEAKQAIDRIFNASQPKNIFTCEQDSDCISVDYDGCCIKKTSINISFFSEYKNTPLWQKDTVDCTEVECGDTSSLTAPKCLPNTSGIRQCTLVSEE